MKQVIQFGVGSTSVSLDNYGKVEVKLAPHRTGALIKLAAQVGGGCFSSGGCEGRAGVTHVMVDASLWAAHLVPQNVHYPRVETWMAAQPPAALAAKLGANAETARELCCRLATICERKKRTSETLSYNGLVESWPEIISLAGESRQASETQPPLF